MDEKELMIPLELGYVEEAERKKNTHLLHFVSDCVEMFITHLPILFKLLMVSQVLFMLFFKNLWCFFLLGNLGGGGKQDTKQWQGGHRARWPTTARVARN